MSSSVRPPWQELYDPNSRRSYYHNTTTGETTWDFPTAGDSPTGPNAPVQPPAGCPEFHQEDEDDEDYGLAAVLPVTGDVPFVADGMSFWSSPGQVDGSVAHLPRPEVPPHLKIFVSHDRRPTAEQLGRPARRQADPGDIKKVAYMQGQEDYNIWYHKHPTDRYDYTNRANREPAVTKCNPFRDAGWTKADLEPETQQPRFCIFFAKGCCTSGPDCRFFHRVPTLEDNDRLPPMEDAFGRERFASHREDMDGVGVFTQDCRTLFIGDIKINRVNPNYHQDMVNSIFKHFAVWGPIENIRVISNKNIAFIRYFYRAAAEFAKVAMVEQPLDGDEQILVRWAHADRNPRAREAQEAAERRGAVEMVHRHMEKIGVNDESLLLSAYQNMWQDAGDGTPTGVYPTPTEIEAAGRIFAESRQVAARPLGLPAGPMTADLAAAAMEEDRLMREMASRREAMIHDVSRMQNVLSTLDEKLAMGDFTVDV